MSSKSWDMARLKKQMGYWMRTHPDAKTRRMIGYWFHLANGAEEDFEMLITEAKQIGARLPDFEGDEMGRPADDFADNDDPEYWDRLRRDADDDQETDSDSFTE